MERAFSRRASKPSLDRLFPENPVLLPEPQLIRLIEEEMPAFAERRAQAGPDEKRMLGREERERSQAALLDLDIWWLQFGYPGR